MRRLPTFVFVLLTLATAAAVLWVVGLCFAGGLALYSSDFDGWQRMTPDERAAWTARWRSDRLTPSVPLMVTNAAWMAAVAWMLWRRRRPDEERPDRPA